MSKSRFCSGVRSGLPLTLLFLVLVYLSFPTLGYATMGGEGPDIIKKAAFKSAKIGDWNVPNSWDPLGVPEAGDSATILATHIITVKGSQSCGNVTINANGTLIIDSTDDVATLTIDN